MAGLPEGSDVDALSSEIELWEGDFDKDGDVDGSDLAALAADPSLMDLSAFAANFGKSNKSNGPD